jgi:hypothetical protein
MPIPIPAGLLFPVGESGTHPELPIALPPNYPSTGPVPGPSHPIVLPPLVGVWPPPGQPTFPIVIPPEVGIPVFPTQPIYIELPPNVPNPVPPGEIWPPLPPEYAGKLVAVIVVGEGKVHWYCVPPPSVPGTPGPKR